MASRRFIMVDPKEKKSWCWEGTRSEHWRACTCWEGLDVALFARGANVAKEGGQRWTWGTLRAMKLSSPFTSQAHYWSKELRRHTGVACQHIIAGGASVHHGQDTGWAHEDDLGKALTYCLPNEQNQEHGRVQTIQQQYFKGGRCGKNCECCHKSVDTSGVKTPHVFAIWEQPSKTVIVNTKVPTSTNHTSCYW